MIFAKSVHCIKGSLNLSVTPIRNLVCTGTRVCVRKTGRNVVTEYSTNQNHSAEIPRSSNFYVCKFTRPSSSSVRGSGSETKYFSQISSLGCEVEIPFLCIAHMTFDPGVFLASSRNKQGED